jgi:hypothetical protein
MKGRYKCNDCTVQMQMLVAYPEPYCFSGHYDFVQICMFCATPTDDRTCQGCSNIPDMRVLEHDLHGMYYKGVLFGRKKRTTDLEKANIFTEFRCLQLEKQNEELRKAVERLEGIVRNLTDMIEFHPDGPETKRAF